MGLLVVGSIALDDIETPVNKVENVLGGSSTYITLAASYFTSPIELIGVVGNDFSKEHIKILKDHKIGLAGLQVKTDGKTFHYGCKYGEDCNNRETIFTDLNVFEKFDPIIPEDFRKSSFVLLGNIAPELQLNVLSQLDSPTLVVCDTMNLWINIARKALIETIKKVDVLVVNDSEAKLLSETDNIFIAAKALQAMGPRIVIIKKGEHGAILFSNDDIFCVPAYPLESIADPTGAGDTFVGGFTGYLHKTKDLSFNNLKRAVVYGTVMASFSVQNFSTVGIENLEQSEITKRYNEFIKMTQFD
ncbi:MAG: PfkB family carbohydrate kinase [Ignavibacteriaceae bacterium]|nr:PfkB family carbohydrate kinase [Ignavibacteriaceae bacterium]